MIQWHPIFAQLLRPALEAFYEVQTTVPVGDGPREADFLVVRRTSVLSPPFQGLGRNLTTWNVFEFQGPTVAPRRGHLESLVEVGLGIDRRLRAAPDATAAERRLAPVEMSFWYLANRLNPRFLRAAEDMLGVLESTSQGRAGRAGRAEMRVSPTRMERPR